MAHLLSQPDDFGNQLSQLEILIKSKGDYCIFLPKFHCELNPMIEMVTPSMSVVSSTYRLTLPAVLP
jgi:hypothetical protein